MLKKEKKKPEKRTARSVESGEVKMDEAQKRLEFESTLYVLHLRDFSSRIVLRHVVVRVIEYDEKRIGKGTGGKSVRGFELNEHSLISEAKFTSGAYSYCCHL